MWKLMCQALFITLLVLILGGRYFHFPDKETERESNLPKAWKTQSEQAAY